MQPVTDESLTDERITKKHSTVVVDQWEVQVVTHLAVLSVRELTLREGAVIYSMNNILKRYIRSTYKAK